MINTELLDSIRYPDQTEGLFFDYERYDDVVEYFKYSIKICRGENKKYYQENLIELERRWKERQEKQAANKNASLNTKKSREITHTSTAKTSPPV